MIFADYTNTMTSVLEIEQAIEKLPREDYRQLRGWIEDYDLGEEMSRTSADIFAMLDEEDGGESQLIEE